MPDAVRPRLRTELRDFRSSARWVIAQLYYGNRDLHYEAWHRAKLGTIEVGLHFEADDLTNERLLGAFRNHERAIRRKLPDARFEEWDRGWARIWEPVPAKALDEALQLDLAERMARYVATLEGILRAELPADVPWSMGTDRATPRRSRHARPR